MSEKKHKIAVKLRGAARHDFLDYLADAYPEYVDKLRGLEEIQIEKDSHLHEIWWDYAESW